MDNGESSYRRFLSGDDYGMVELIRDHKDSLILYVFGYVHDIHTSEDLVQDTFVKLAVDKPKFNGRSTFKTWLFAIARNTAFDYLRKTARRKHIPIEDISEQVSETDVEIESLIDEQKRELYKALNALRSEYRQVLILSYLEGFSNDEAAKIMHKSKRQIENLHYNAKKALKTELERRGFDHEKL